MMYVPFIIYVLVASIILGLVFSKKFRKWFVITVISVALIAAILSLHGIARAEDIAIKEGIITRVAPELFNGYPVLIVTVKTFDEQVYTYYSENEIDMEGVVTLTLFGDEVLDVK